MEVHTSTPLHEVHGLGAATRPSFGLRGWLRSVIGRARTAARKRRDYHRLLSMSDAGLRDIGVTRSDVLCAYYGGPIRRSAIRSE